MSWREGLRILEERVAALPALVREAAETSSVEIEVVGAREVVATGVGSSAAHAKLLVHLLDGSAARARFLPLSAFLGDTPRGARADLLVVFSQGLSPNARIPLATAHHWRRVVVVTTVSEGDAEKAAFLDGTAATVVRYPGADEYGTLVRVIGPMTGAVAAFRVARAIGGEGVPELDGDAVARRIEEIHRRPPAIELAALDGDIAFLASGTYGELVDNLRYKVLEGMLLPEPPVWDVLGFAHGPFQQAFSGRATLVALARRDAPREAELLEKIERMLDPERHRLLRLGAELPGALALFEHEAAMNRCLLAYVEGRRVDQTRWPGRGRDAPVYGVEETAPAPKRHLDELTWTEVERAIAGGLDTVVVPLGSTEQHGPHLPLATDCWIADALAERFCARVEEAIQAPTLALGCASEHLDFAGTLSLGVGTLESILADLVRSLRRHRFRRLFLFSAHGGNEYALRDALPRLRAIARPMELIAFADLDRLTRTVHAASEDEGVGAPASGHHAGEFETSIVLGLRPGAVREERKAGLLVHRDAQQVFYPSLRDNARAGTVGDPAAADGSRAERYLSAWVELLVDAYRQGSPSQKRRTSRTSASKRSSSRPVPRTRPSK